VRQPISLVIYSYRPLIIRIDGEFTFMRGLFNTSRVFNLYLIINDTDIEPTAKATSRSSSWNSANNRPTNDAVDMSFCTSLRNFIQIGPPSAEKNEMTLCRFSRWRISRSVYFWQVSTRHYQAHWHRFYCHALYEQSLATDPASTADITSPVPDLYIVHFVVWFSWGGMGLQVWCRWRNEPATPESI